MKKEARKVKKLSIIIPVYNVEKYLDNCLNSILEKNLENYEIILVNDGSTDSSGKICNKYANEYNEIKVFHQENKGLSGARNTGIMHAEGEFLMFVDSDDFISKDIKLNDVIEKLNCDVTQYKWIYYYENKNKYVYFSNHNQYKGSIANILRKKIRDGTISVSACDKIVRRKIVIDNKLFFKEGILSEDLDWSLRLYLKIQSIQDINQDIYVYRQQRKGSITNKIGKKNILDLYNILYYWYHYEYEKEQFKIAYYNYLAYHYVILLMLINKYNCDKELKSKIYALEDLLNYSENNKVRLCNRLFNTFGKKTGIYILKIYNFLKNKGLIKI